MAKRNDEVDKSDWNPCAARRCDEKIRPENKGVFCRRHWKMLTPTLRKAWEAGMHEDVLDFLVRKGDLICQAYEYELHATGAFWKWALLHKRQHNAVYNFAFDIWKAWNEENRGKRGRERSKKPNSGHLYTRFNLERAPTMPWLSECTANARNYAIRDCASAWEDWKAGKHGRPRPKRWSDPPRFTIQPPTGSMGDRWMQTHVRERAIKLPKIGWIRTKEQTDMQGKILRLAFECRAGRWFVKCMVERDRKQQIVDRQPGGVVGLDLGMLSILTLSRPYQGVELAPNMGDDRQTILPPRPLQQNLRRKRQRSRKWSRKASAAYIAKLHALVAGPLPVSKWKGHSKDGHFQALMGQALKLHHVAVNGDVVTLLPRGKQIADDHPLVTIFLPDGTQKTRAVPSQEWKDQKAALGRLDFHVEQIRRDALNKLSTWLVRHYDTVVCEGFNVKELVRKRNRKVRSRRVRREMGDLGWGGLRQRLTYKFSMGWYGGTYLQLPADLPTKRTCHACGFVIDEDAMPRSSEFRCPQCNNKTSVQRNTALYCESFGLRSDPTGGQPGSNDAGDRGNNVIAREPSGSRTDRRAGSKGPSQGGKERVTRTRSDGGPPSESSGDPFLSAHQGERARMERPAAAVVDVSSMPVAVPADGGGKRRRRRRRRKDGPHEESLS